MARDEKRRDPGEFYPGGKVWVKPGQSQPQGRVTWQQIEGKPDFSDVADLTPADGVGDVKRTVNKISEKMRS